MSFRMCRKVIRRFCGRLDVRNIIFARAMRLQCGSFAISSNLPTSQRAAPPASRPATLRRPVPLRSVPFRHAGPRPWDVPVFYSTIVDQSDTPEF